MNISEACPFSAGSIVYPYLRHSPGDTQSIDSQESYVLDWCRQHQIVVPRVFKDEARSGASTAGRDDFLAMIDTLRDQSLKPRPAGVLLWSFSRFARDYDDAEFYKADLRRRGYIIHSLTDQIPDGPFGRVIESITHWKDEERLREISKDSKRGLQWLAQQGYSVGGCPPRGYKKSQPIQVGNRKNGEPRLAHKWEIDPEFEGRAQLAWQLKIRGETNWAIHKATRLFASINCYPSFFTNVTYAGYRKCAELIVPNAHPVYVSKEEFDRIQAMHQPTQEGKPRGSAEGHPRQRAHNNAYLFTGIFYCGECGSAMIGHTDTHSAAYRCGRSKQHGKESCHQPAIVAHAVHDLVLDWLSSDILAYDHIAASRSLIVQQLQGVQSELEGKRANMREELESVDRRIQNLMNALEEGGWSPEIESRLGERRTEKAQIELAVGRVEEQLKRGKIDVSDEALKYLCNEMNRQLRSEDPAESRSVVQRVVKRVELKKDKLVIEG